MFEDEFYSQLKELVGSNIKVAVHEVLYTGQLVSVKDSILTLLAKTDSYERETRKILIPLWKVNYVQVDADRVDSF